MSRETPLLADADAVLPGPVVPQCFEVVGGRETKVVELFGILKRCEFVGHALDAVLDVGVSAD